MINRRICEACIFATDWNTWAAHKSGISAATHTAKWEFGRGVIERLLWAESCTYCPHGLEFMSIVGRVEWPRYATGTD